MRRADREISDPAAIRAILEEAMVCRVAMASGDRPYISPVRARQTLVVRVSIRELRGKQSGY